MKCCAAEVERRAVDGTKQLQPYGQQHVYVMHVLLRSAHFVHFARIVDLFFHHTGPCSVNAGQCGQYGVNAESTQGQRRAALTFQVKAALTLC
jgi:hypothetical protein